MNTPTYAITLLNKLHGIKGNGDGWTAKCPNHQDRENSLSIHEKNGKVLVTCFAGCAVKDVVESVGLTLSDLFQKGDGRTSYTIRTREGRPVARHVRIEKGDSKVFSWERPNGASGLGGLPTEHLPLWGVERLGDSTYVIVCEGEKAAQSLINRGYPAVATVTGASGTPSRDVLKALVTPLPEGGHLVRAAMAIRAKFVEPSDAERFYVHGRRAVYLWPDNDDIGRAHMDRVAERLVQIGEWPLMIVAADLPEKGDAADYEGSIDELLGAAEPWAGRDPTDTSICDDFGLYR